MISNIWKLQSKSGKMLKFMDNLVICISFKIPDKFVKIPEPSTRFRMVSVLSNEPDTSVDGHVSVLILSLCSLYIMRNILKV